jgi:DNA-binding response OmpR family regulator
VSDGRTILLVDDDREVLQMTALLLRSDGYDVATAASGEEALYAVREATPDAVLLDINMPGMDGWEVLRVLKEDRRTADIPVVVFSVNFEVREKLRALQQGAADYVVKPFDTQRFLERMRTLLNAGAEDRR